MNVLLRQKDSLTTEKSLEYCHGFYQYINTCITIEYYKHNNNNSNVQMANLKNEC